MIWYPLIGIEDEGGLIVRSISLVLTMVAETVGAAGNVVAVIGRDELVPKELETVIINV